MEMVLQQDKWIAISTAFVLGVTSSFVLQKIFKSFYKPSPSESVQTVDYESDDDSDSDSDSEDYIPHKMLLVVRKDLKMTKGKTVAQCCHATLGAYKRGLKYNPDGIRRWEQGGQAKITVQIDSEDELMTLEEVARATGLVTYIVVDAGKTQISAGSKTVLAIGPDTIEKIDSVAKHLRLL